MSAANGAATTPSALTRLIDAFSAFIDLAAAAVEAGVDLVQARLGQARRVRITEARDGAYVLPGAPEIAPFRLDGADPLPPAVALALRGREVELALDPTRFLSRPLDLPQGATPFLDGIVRAQMDRLTPWSAAEAAFGWTLPEPAEDGRIRVLVAATARARLRPCLDTLKALGARRTTFTTCLAPGDAPLVIRTGAAEQVQGSGRPRQILIGILAGAALAASLASAFNGFAAGGLDADLQALDQRIAAHRRAIASARGGQDTDGAALRTLERLKGERAATVLVLEALSEVLPDDTFLTGLLIEGGKVELTGISAEAPALVRLLEDTRRFSAATFVAPTTRQPGEAGERFQIEARVTLPLEVAR